MGQSTCLEHLINYSKINCIHIEEKLDICSRIPPELKAAVAFILFFFIAIELLLPFQLRKKVNAYIQPTI